MPGQINQPQIAWRSTDSSFAAMLFLSKFDVSHKDAQRFTVAVASTGVVHHGNERSSEFGHSALAFVGRSLCFIVLQRIECFEVSQLVRHVLLSKLELPRFCAIDTYPLIRECCGVFYLFLESRG